MQQTSIDFETLALRMRKDLRRTGLLRRLVRCLACIAYTLALAWFGFCCYGVFSVDSLDDEASRYAVAGFVVFCVAHYAFLWSFKALARSEERTMRQIVVSLFPGASYDPKGKADAKALAASRLFATPTAAGSSVNAIGYGSLDVPVGDRWMRVADVGVTSGNGKDLGSMNFVEVLYRYFVRPIFGARVESTMHDFRGMFGCCRLGRSFRGYVMLLPDRLEDKIGHMAQTIQRLRQRYGAEFVHLEDPEFERLFVVYADDEVEARMVLTPAMMRRLTALRRTFRRDLMLSPSAEIRSTMPLPRRTASCVRAASRWPAWHSCSNSCTARWTSAAPSPANCNNNKPTTNRFQENEIFSRKLTLFKYGTDPNPDLRA